MSELLFRRSNILTGAMGKVPYARMPTKHIANSSVRHSKLGQLFSRGDLELQQSLTVKCPYCGENILKQEGDTKVLKDKVTLFKENKTISYCKRCGRAVEVPVRVISAL